MKRILVLATGGTIASTAQKKGLAPGINIDQLADYFKQYSPSRTVTIAFLSLMNKDSTNMQPEDWLEIAKTIRRSSACYDSFIITHGTDTMAFTAAALSYLLHDLSRTVVLTGSQIPASFHKTDARRNIQDALTFATQSVLPGVFVVFDGIAIAGTRAVKMRTKSYDAFKSVNYPVIASIENGNVCQMADYKKEQSDHLPVSMALCPDVLLLRLFPGLSPIIFDFLLEHAKGVIIESFGNGGVPFEGRDLTAGVRKLHQAGIPVVVTTQCLEEGQNLELYEVGKRAAEAGGMTAGDMNTEAIVAKLMWILAQTHIITEVKQLLQTPIALDLNYI
ncbi:MAG: asparaginase [Sporolactobacillus sp.]